MFPEKIEKDPKNVFSGEREIGVRYEDFSPDHLNRYRFVQYFVRPGDAILDAACGVGYGTSLLAEKAREVEGIDYSEEAVAYALSHWQRPNTRFHRGDLLDESAYPQRLFDKIVSFETIEHLADDRRFLGYLRQRLIPGGTLFISAPNADVIDVKDNPWHVRHYQPDEFYALLKQYFRHVVEFTQIDNGIRRGRGGDNNVLVCSDSCHIRYSTWKFTVHYALYKIKTSMYK